MRMGKKSKFSYTLDEKKQIRRELQDILRRYYIGTVTEQEKRIAEKFKDYISITDLQPERLNQKITLFERKQNKELSLKVWKNLLEELDLKQSNEVIRVEKHKQRRPLLLKISAVAAMIAIVISSFYTYNYIKSGEKEFNTFFYSTTAT